MNIKFAIHFSMSYSWVLLFSLFFFSCNSKPKEPDFVVASSQIYKEFQENEVAAITKYKGKLIRVTGTLISFTNTFGVNYCNIGSPDDIFGEVQCAMSEEFAKKSSQFKVGDDMWVEGTCTGADIFGRVQIQ